MAKAVKAKPGILIDNQDLFCRSYQAGKKTVELNGIKFGMRKVTNRVTVKTTAHPEGVPVLEHWLVVQPVDGSFYPKANIPYPHRSANSRTDLL